MKKYIMLLAGLVAALSSCNNDSDDVAVKYATVFQVRPATVIEPFTYQMNAGELESFKTDHKLRVRLLIFGANGLLEAQETQYVSNYATVVNKTISLAEGTYTAVAITDLVQYANNSVAQEYWTLSGESKLSEMRIKDGGDYSVGLNKILGITNQTFTVGSGRENALSIHVKPAGVLFCVYLKNIHYISDLKNIILEMSRTADYYFFNANGEYDVVQRNNNNSFDWQLATIRPEIYVVDNIYSYYYMPPLGNTNFRFTGDTSTSHTALSGMIVINCQAGAEYYVELSMGNSNAVNFERVDGKTF